MNDPDTTRAMVGAVDAPKREPAASPDFTADIGKLAYQLDGCIRTLCTIVDAHTDEIAALPPAAESNRRRNGHAIWRDRAYQLRALQSYYENLSDSLFTEAATVSMDRSASG